MNKEKIREFFETGFDNGRINFEYILEGKKHSKVYKSKMKYYSKEAIKEFEEWNEQGYGIFYLPNGGGYKNEEITDFRACFVDMDIKDELEHEIVVSGFTGARNELQELVKARFNSLKKEQTFRYKQSFNERIIELEEMGIPPSAVVETKNGYHVYYLLEAGAQRHEFETIEGLLIYIFNADAAVKNPARLLRVPNTLHLKEPNDPFTIKLGIFKRNIRYDAEELIVRLKEIIENVNIKMDSQLCVNSNKAPTYNNKLLPSNKGLPARIGIDYSNIDIGNISLISRGFEGLPELKSRLGVDNQPELCYIDRNDIRQFLKRQNLKQLLGIESDRFLCIFHNSSNSSSGNIYKYEDKWFYKCHSSRCGVHYDIVQVIERMTRLPIHKAFNYLKQLYNIAEVKTEWQMDQEQLIDFNIEFLERFKYDVDLHNNYPFLSKFLRTKGTLSLLIQIHEVARRKLPQLATMKSLEVKNTNAIVFAPIRKVIEEILNHDSSAQNINKANTKVIIMIFMYLLNTIGIDELPDEMQKKVKEYQKSSFRNGETFRNLARYYEIVSMDTERLMLAEEMSKFFYSNHLTISSFKREQLLGLCGVEEANRVFPERVEEDISEINQRLSDLIYKLVIMKIGVQGWTCDSEVVELLRMENIDYKQLYKDNFKFNSNRKSELDLLEVNDYDKGFQCWLNTFLLRKMAAYMPVILVKTGYLKARVNKELRRRLNIPLHIKGSVYHQTVDSEEDNDDKASKIRRLKQNDTSLSNSKIAELMSCSRQYVSNVLKRQHR
ncbi:hypothetical protein [Paenibacillus silvae]|uniref:Uncharacterized protein n=1 Tax=Paenibacillus silvae TaxID=1325358 RepID=A0A2W6NFD2_9BACL|nr:hypothetical protein [Paenibacillus silvae]PZT54355.1 hypothetical protein DN757_17655 [Paenibacillus silvae]